MPHLYTVHFDLGMSSCNVVLYRRMVLLYSVEGPALISGKVQEEVLK